jgi:ATP-binding cassette subfamily B protein
MNANLFSSKRKLAIFLSYYKPHRRLFALDLSCALGISLIDLAFPLVSRYSLQVLLPHRAYAIFALVVGLCLLGFAFRAALQYVVTYWGHLLGVRMETDMRRDLFTHLQKLSFSFYDRTRTGHLMSRVLSDLFEIVELAHHGPEDLFIAAITLSGSFVAMAFIRWQLALVLVVLVPAIIWLVIRQRKAMSMTSLAVKQRTAVINAGVESSISGIRVAKAFVNEDYEIEKFRKSNDLYRDAKKLFYKAMGVFHCGMEFATSVLNVVVIGVGGLFIARGMMDLGDLVAFTLFVAAFLQPIRKLVAFFEQYTTGMAGFERFVELMRVEPEIVDRPGARELSREEGGRARGEIEFRDVSFSYAGGQPVLQHVDLKVEGGRSLALVGPSGGGKSTICQLIPRFYEVGSGAVLVDGVDVRDIALDSLRDNVGIVQQDVFLFADTIKENIRYGKPEASDEEIVLAARRADIHDFIESLPEGYDTQVGERGVLLSGGQKQRVSIARIFLKDPPILILDEATSALDTQTELRIQAALEELSRGRTCLLIAHRLSTIRDADEIAFVDRGRVLERGSHAELLAARGRYAALYGAQFSFAYSETAQGAPIREK